MPVMYSSSHAGLMECRLLSLTHSKSNVDISAVPLAGWVGGWVGGSKTEIGLRQERKTRTSVCSGAACRAWDSEVQLCWTEDYEGTPPPFDFSLYGTPPPAFPPPCGGGCHLAFFPLGAGCCCFIDFLVLLRLTGPHGILCSNWQQGAAMVRARGKGGGKGARHRRPKRPGRICKKMEGAPRNVRAPCIFFLSIFCLTPLFCFAVAL